MAHPMDHEIDCPKCGTPNVAPSHYDDGADNSLFTPMWLCHGCYELTDVEDLQALMKTNVDLLRNS